jgi:hypothetical protein
MENDPLRGLYMWPREVALPSYLSYPVSGGIARPRRPRGQILGIGPPGWELGAGLTTLPRKNPLFKNPREAKAKLKGPWSQRRRRWRKIPLVVRLMNWENNFTFEIFLISEWKMKMSVFWNVAPCSLVESDWRFGGVAYIACHQEDDQRRTFPPDYKAREPEISPTKIILKKKLWGCWSTGPSMLYTEG